MASISGLINPYSKTTNWCIVSWARVILWISRIKLRIEGLENINKSSAHVYIINHISKYDIPAIIVAVPQTARFIAKKELFKIPLFAAGMRLSGMLAIDRGNNEEAIKTLNKAIRTINNNNVSVLIFPEGTRSKSGGIEKFKKGGFIVALNGHIPIIPTVISGSQYIVPKDSRLVKKGTVSIKFLKEVDTSDFTFESRNELVEIVHNRMVTEFNPDFNKK